MVQDGNIRQGEKKISPIVEMTKVVGWAGAHSLCHLDRRQGSEDGWILIFCVKFRNTVLLVIIVTGTENLQQWFKMVTPEKAKKRFLLSSK